MKSGQRGLWTLLLIVCFLLTACSSGSSPGASGIHSTGKNATSLSAKLSAPMAAQLALPAHVAPTEKLPAKPPAGKVIAFLNNGSPDIASAQLEGLQQAGTVLGWRVINVTIDLSQPTSIASGITSAVRLGANAIMVPSADAALYRPTLPLLRRDKVTLVTTDSANQSAKNVMAILSAGPTFGQAGKTIGAAVVADAKASGRKPQAVATFIPQVADLQQPAYNAEQAAIEAAGGSLDKLIVPLSDVRGGQSTQDVVSYLQSHPNVRFVIANAGDVVSGLREALASAGLPPVTVIGVAPTKAELNDLRSHDDAAWVLLSYVGEGWSVVDALARLWTDQPVTVWTGAATPQVFVTAGNISKVPNIAAPLLPVDTPSQFKSLWRVS